MSMERHFVSPWHSYFLAGAALVVVVVGGGNACGVDACSKLDRASGECLGAVCRRKTCQAAIRGRERQARNDLPISEWGNPAGVMTCHPAVLREGHAGN